MPIIKSYSQIVRDMVDRLRLVQPNLDTKPGSVARDLFVDLQADEIEKLYSLISIVSEKQSFATATGADLDKLSRNFGFLRKNGSRSSGTVVFSLDSIDADHEIPEGTIVSTRSGISFRTIGNFTMLLSEKNVYSANASRIKKQLDVAGASTGFAVEIPIEAVNPGVSGNVGSYQIINQSSPFNFSVTNISSLSGGTNIESDSQFRRRFLSGFSGANIGTSSGYSNSILEDENVLDLLVVEPGDSLMLRDGTEIIEGDFNQRRIISSGTGGKVDIYVLGKSLREVSESFIFFNKSTSGEISDSNNDYILGNSNQDLTLTASERRRSSLSSGSVPLQPVDEMISVVGEESGVLTEGINYELVKDTNSDTGGSPFGLDRIRFVSNTKYVDEEIVTKKSKNSSDALEFSDALNIYECFQDVGIENENSSVLSYDKSLIKVNHSPILSVTRVFNLTTGEDYSVEDMFLEDGVNTDGIIKISGKRLPSVTDKLQVDYIWRKYFDPSLDYFSAPNVSSIDWSVSSKKEGYSILNLDTNYSINMDDDIFNVNNVYIFSSSTSAVSLDSGSMSVTLPNTVKNVYSIRKQGVEVFRTIINDGSFSGSKIFFPSDSGVELGDEVFVIYNTVSIYSFDDIKGTFQDSTIYLPDTSVFDEETKSLINSAYASEEMLLVDFEINPNSMVPSVPISSFPIYSNASSIRFFNGSGSPISGSYKTSEKNNNEFVRFSPSRVVVAAQSIVSEGSIKIFGDTIKRYDITVESGLIFDGKKISLKGLFSEDGIAKLISASISGKELGINGYKVRDGSYSNDAVSLSSLKDYEIEIPSISQNNISFSVGEMMTVSFFSYKKDDSEFLNFYSDSELETQKVFLSVKEISVASGFTSGGQISGSVELLFGNQPQPDSQYFANYDFKAPKEGERVFVSYYQNRVISDATIRVESARPITADVLVKEAFQIGIDVYASIVISSDFANESETIRDNAIDQVASLLSTNVLGSIIDYSDVIRAITNVTGVESADVSLFNYSGESGRRDFVRALSNQSIVPNVIDISVVSRKDFRIS